MLRFETTSFVAFDVIAEFVAGHENAEYIAAVMNAEYGNLARYEPHGDCIVARWTEYRHDNETIDDVRKSARKRAQKIESALHKELELYRRLRMWSDFVSRSNA